MPHVSPDGCKAGQMLMNKINKQISQVALSLTAYTV